MSNWILESGDTLFVTQNVAIGLIRTRASTSAELYNNTTLICSVFPVVLE